MIVAYAGRRPSEDEFPEAYKDNVGDLLDQLLVGLQPRMAVGSAAAGSDLLALQGAVKAGARAHVVLPGGRDDFRASSVVDRDGEWGVRYDALLASDSVIENPLDLDPGGDDATYRAATERIWSVANAERDVGEGLIVVVVAGSRAEGVTDHTEELAARQQAEGGLLIRIDPTAAPDEQPRGFVAMPFGTKRWHDMDWLHYRADLSYLRIFMPALIGAGYHPLRADTEALLEVIDSKMLSAINRADVLVADLATENPNVMWELGVRHAWKRSGTILVVPEGAKVPFDVGRVPVSQYRREESHVSDEDVIHGISMVQDLLAEVAEGHVDSPVFANVQGLEPVELLPGDEGSKEEGDRVGDLLERITLAADLRSADDLLALSEDVAGNNRLDQVVRSALSEQVGIALNSLGRHGDAAPILRSLAEADADFSRVRLQEQFAHALIRDANKEQREERLAEAESRLEALIERQRVSGETYGLLGSAAKARVELAISEGRDALPQLQRALDAYVTGLRDDPGDYYPGINAVALLRLRGQHLRQNYEDLERARALLPVVRFAVTRVGEGNYSSDPWALLTLAECELHEAFMESVEDPVSVVAPAFERAAAQAGIAEKRSAIRQLEMIRAAGDPATVINTLLSLFA